MKTEEIYSIFATVLANKDTYRIVIEFFGDHKGENMLIDFSNCGDPFEDGKVCFWTLYKSLEHGTEELDYGSCYHYGEVIRMIKDSIEGTEYEMWYETF